MLTSIMPISFEKTALVLGKFMGYSKIPTIHAETSMVDADDSV